MTPMTIARRTRKKDEGFTLVELMVVVMIIAILMAIAIPTFLNSRKRAQDAAAKSNVRNSLAAAQAVFTETQGYPITGPVGTVGTMLNKLTDEEPSLTFVATASTDAKTVSVYTSGTSVTATGTTVVVSVLGKSDKCFSFINVAATGGGTTEYMDDSDAACTAAAIPPGAPVTP